MNPFSKISQSNLVFDQTDQDASSLLPPDSIGASHQVITTIHLSSADSPFSIAFKTRPLYETLGQTNYFSPGVIKFQSNRNTKEGWQIMGVLHPTFSATNQGEIPVEIHHETLGLTRREGIITHSDHHVLADQPFTLAKALPGYGMGYHEIRPFFVIDSPESYLFNFSAI